MDIFKIRLTIAKLLLSHTKFHHVSFNRLVRHHRKHDADDDRAEQRRCKTPFPLAAPFFVRVITDTSAAEDPKSKFHHLHHPFPILSSESFSPCSRLLYVAFDKKAMRYGTFSPFYKRSLIHFSCGALFLSDALSGIL